MSETSTNLNEAVTGDTPAKMANTGLGRYFDNNSHTIFDELVSPNKSDVIDTVPHPVLEIPEIASSKFYHNTLKECGQLLENLPTTNFHRDAWIPSENTRKVLRTIATSSYGGNTLDREMLTMPGLGIQEDMIDPIKEASLSLLDNEESTSRNVSTILDVTRDERGLRHLIHSGCYRAAVNLSGRLLAIYGQGFGKMNQPSKHTPHSLQLWFTRLSLLTKLKQTEILETESKPFGNLDKPDMYFTFYPELYGTRPGSMASFAFRLLLAEIPNYYGKSKQAIDNLYGILATVRKIIKNLESGQGEDRYQLKLDSDKQEDSLKLWKGRKCRTLISIINCALGMKNYILAIEVFENLYKSVDWEKSEAETLMSAMKRVHLSLGDVFTAEKKFSVARENPLNSKVVSELVDRGLMAVAQNAFQEALNCFQTASTLDPFNVMLVNNIAVCLLYTGKLEAAVLLMENAITRNPVKSLQESVILNLCTLYELHTTHSKQSKLHLLRQLSRYKGDSIDIRCLKLVI